MSRSLKKSRRYPKAYSVNELEPGQIFFSIQLIIVKNKKLSINKFLEYTQKNYHGTNQFYKVVSLTNLLSIEARPVATMPFSKGPTLSTFYTSKISKYWQRYIVKPQFIRQLVKRGMVKILDEKLLF